jgi:hypothetical protein
MHGLPANIDLAFLQNRELQQVCIGRHEAILHFGDDVSITIFSDIGHRSELGEIDAIYKRIMPAAPTLCNLINASITKASAAGPGTLVLVFSTGEELEIYDSSSAYESYHIANRDNLIVV